MMETPLILFLIVIQDLIGEPVLLFVVRGHCYI